MGINITFCLCLAFSAMPHIYAAICPKVTQNPMASLLQNILNPANADRAKQILQLTGATNKVAPASPVLNLLKEVAVARPKQVVVQNQVKEIPLLQNKLYPRQVIGQQIVEVPKLPTQVVQEYVQYTNVPSCPSPIPKMPTQVVQEYVQYPPMPSRGAPMSPMYPYASPVPYVNPFLPAASPVSALAPPTSNLLPPVNPTQVRSHFLRKVPIPPPCI